MEDEIKVSVYCLAYNHEKYIEDALKGFVSQKTDFKFEVFVHDDCSTDSTKKIIEKYAAQYPEIIKPIYQTENQYSKGVKIVKTFIDPVMRSKYVAICEGDDYWCNENKLQKQVDFLEAHPEYSACVHNTKEINSLTGEETLMNSLKTDCDLETEKILERGNGQFQLSSLIYRKELKDEMPDIFKKDYGLSIYLSLRGKIRYFADVMSVYRKFTASSWTASMYVSKTKEAREKLEKHNVQIFKILDDIDEYTNNKYHDIITRVKSEHELYILRHFNDYKMMIKRRKELNVSFYMIIKAFAKFILKK